MKNINGKSWYGGLHMNEIKSSGFKLKVLSIYK